MTPLKAGLGAVGTRVCDRVGISAGGGGRCLATLKMKALSSDILAAPFPQLFVSVQL